MRSPFRAVGLDEARRHELDKFRERVAFSEQNSASLFGREQPSLACYGVRK
jgi:hypothetical protein